MLHNKKTFVTIIIAILPYYYYNYNVDYRKFGREKKINGWS